MIILRILILGIICSALQYFYPWWSMAISAFALGILFGQNGFKNFLTGFLGVGIAWFLYALYLSSANEHLLASRIAQLLQLESLETQTNIASTWLLMILTALIGGVVAGFSTMSGGFFRAIFKKKKTT